MKVAVSLIVVFFVFALILFFVVPFALQNITIPGFSTGGSGVAGIFKSIDGGDFWFSKNSIDGSSSNIGSTNILDLVSDPFDNNILYLGTDGSGIFRSINNGETWKKLVDDNGELSSNAIINQIAIDPQNPSHIFITVFQNGSGAIFKSEDAGRSWKQIYIVPLAKQDIKTIVIDQADPRKLYAGTTAGVLITEILGGW